MFLLVRLESDPLTAPFVAAVAALSPQWDATSKQETAQSDGLLAAKARAIAADHVLNRLADQVSAAIHGGKQADVTLDLHQLYFGSSTPSDAVRPILGTQLALMSSWPDLLSKATQPALLALAPSAAVALDAAHDADEKLKMAEVADDKFWLDGERKQLFDAYNAVAATTFGGLKAIVHDHPELKLGVSWAESFFLHESRKEGPTTIKQADAEVKRVEAELVATKQRLNDLVARQKAAEEAREKAAQAVVEVAAAKKETAAAKQREREAIAAAKKAKRAKI